MRGLLAAFARNTVFANIVLVILFVAGIFAGVSMVRENFPEFSLDMIIVTVPYPGADPEEVEEGISRKIEEAIEGIEGIKQYTTESSENVGSTIIEVQEDYDLQEVLDKVRSEIDSISTFPLDAEQPVITELTLREPVVWLYVSGDMNERRLKEWSERIKDELQGTDAISQVEIFGARDYEIGIEVSEARLREYGLSFDQVADTIRRSNLNMAGGVIRTQGEEIRVRTMGRKYTGKEIADIVVLADADGSIIPLGRVADIDDGFTEDPIRCSINGERALMVIVYKTKEEDSIKISEAVQGFVAEKQKVLPAGANFQTFYDNTDMLRKRMDLLVRNGLIGLGIVFAILWLFLDVRLSFWVGMGLPISIAGAVAILWGIGGTLNMISLFGFIMVLGVVVDDAIIVGESIFVHRKRGKPPLRAAVDGVQEVGLPVVAAVTTTIVAFLPLAFVGGIMGKFIRILPFVVMACLAVSLLECLILLPAHLSHLPDPNTSPARKRTLGGRIERLHRALANGIEWFVAHVYQPFLRQSMKWRYISFCTAVSLLFITVGVVSGGFIKFTVFPDVDGFVATATIEFNDGTPIEVTQDAIDHIEDTLLHMNETMETASGDPMLLDHITLVGETLQDIPEFGTNVGSVQAILLESAKRGIHSKEIMMEWERRIGSIPGLKSLTMEGLSAGPPGAPIEIWIQGYDMGNILAASKELMDRLHRFDGVFQIRSDFSPGKNEVRLSLRPEARALGLTVDDLARQISAGFFGNEALRIQRGREDIRVKVRYTQDERRQASTLDKVRIRTREGHEVPLYSVADVSYAPGYSTITRTDGLRRVAVSAEVDSNRANTNEIFQALASDFFPGLRTKYPDLRIALQGEQKKMRESFTSLYFGFPLAVLGIFVIIAAMFRSYAQPFVIMFTVPFGIIGAVAGHLLLGFDLSIMSIFGMVALTGVVVNDAIVLIERVNENIAEGMPFFEALHQGGGRRFRAIILTTISTVGGLMPMILEQDLQARFLIPMALALAAGVTFATVLTLVLIPSLLAILSDFRMILYRIRHGCWVAREELEPASLRNLDLMSMTEEQARACRRPEEVFWSSGSSS
ncbi:MAG: efflux RND transporter permease subunit [Desulfobacteraceae bacterium]|jgi:multidrug efflux pump subunit AcrB